MIFLCLICLFIIVMFFVVLESNSELAVNIFGTFVIFVVIIGIFLAAVSSVGNSTFTSEYINHNTVKVNGNSFTMRNSDIGIQFSWYERDEDGFLELENISSRASKVTVEPSKNSVAFVKEIIITELNNSPDWIVPFDINNSKNSYTSYVIKVPNGSMVGPVDVLKETNGKNEE